MVATRCLQRSPLVLSGMMMQRQSIWMPSCARSFSLRSASLASSSSSSSSSHSHDDASVVPNRLPDYQRHFQEHNGLPVHLRGGELDRWIMRGIYTLMGLGLLSSAIGMSNMMRGIGKIERAPRDD